MAKNKCTCGNNAERVQDCPLHKKQETENYWFQDDEAKKDEENE